MTDEKKKHWLSQITLGEWFSNAQYYYRPRNNNERNLMHSCYEEGYNDGFSNGLAEGKPKWHDLREDPTDLPPKEHADSSHSINVFTDTEDNAFYSYLYNIWVR